MKKEYKLGEDIFLAMAVFLIGAAIIMKLFDASFPFGLIVIGPRQLLTIGNSLLLINIALNIQELARK